MNLFTGPPCIQRRQTRSFALFKLDVVFCLSYVSPHAIPLLRKTDAMHTRTHYST